MPYYNGRWHLYDERERREYGQRKREERSQEWHTCWISKQGLKHRLWIDKSIAEFLPRPQKAGKINHGMVSSGRSDRREPPWIYGMDGKTAGLAGCVLPASDDFLFAMRK